MIRFILVSAILTFGTQAAAKDMADIGIGDIVCYDAFGPWDVIGTVLSKNYSDNTVTIRRTNGQSDSYAARKIKSPTYCKVKNGIGKELLKRGIDAMSKPEDNS